MERERLAFLIKEISMSLYTDLSEGDKVYLGKDLNSIINSDPKENLKNLSELFENLVDCKNSIKGVDFFEEFSENQGYQKALQKLDKEVRTHIKYELQMKVLIDSLEEKLLTSQTQGSISLDSKKKLLEKVKEENKHLKVKLATKDKEITDLNTENNLINAKEITNIKQKMQKDQEKISSLEKSLTTLKQKCAHSKIELDLKNREYEKQKNDFLSLRKLIGNVDIARLNHTNIDKSERNNKDSFEIPLRGSKLVKTPNKATKSVSPLPLQYQKILLPMQNAQSTKRIEKSPLSKVFKTDLAEYKQKSRITTFKIQKK